MYDYLCETCGKIFEELVPAGTFIKTCPECGSEAHYKFAMPKFRYMGMGVNPNSGMTTAADKWTKAHETHNQGGEYDW